MNFPLSPRFQAVLFDMDGTLLDTLSDMQDAVNHILLENGWPQRTLEEIRAFGKEYELEVLAELEKMGVKTAVVSNKPDATTKALAEKFFPGMPALGQRDGVDPKPSPALVAQALSDLGVRPENAVYVGDSEVDVAPARNAGLPLSAVSWGVRGREKLEIAGAEHIADTAPQLLKMLCR